MQAHVTQSAIFFEAGKYSAHKGTPAPSAGREWHAGQRCVGTIIKAFENTYGWEECTVACLKEAPINEKSKTGATCCSSQGIDGNCELRDNKAVEADDKFGYFMLVDGKSYDLKKDSSVRRSGLLGSIILLMLASVLMI